MRIFLLGFAMTFASVAQAADSNGEFAIKGAGVQTCGGLVTAWDENSRDLSLYLGWMDGYLTGMNQHQPDTFDIAPWQNSLTLLGLTKRLCDQSDESTLIIDAFNRLMADFHPARLSEKSDAVGLQSDDQAVVLYTEIVIRMQRRLAALGFDPVTRDGTLDSPTLDALKAYQIDRGLEQTGLPDQNTLFSLFVQQGAPD